jgi:hypothetical protein
LSKFRIQKQNPGLFGVTVFFFMCSCFLFGHDAPCKRDVSRYTGCRSLKLGSFKMDVLITVMTLR